MAVYHLTKNSRNFTWVVNGKIILVCPNGKFQNKRNVFKGRSKFPTGIFERKTC